MESSLDSPSSHEKILSKKWSPYFLSLVCGSFASIFFLKPLLVLCFILGPLPVLYCVLNSSVRTGIKLSMLFGLVAMLPTVIEMTKIMSPFQQVGLWLLFSFLLALPIILTRLVLGRLSDQLNISYFLFLPWVYGAAMAGIAVLYNLPFTGHWMPVLAYQSFEVSRQLMSVAGSYTVLFLIALIAGALLVLVLSRTKKVLVNTAAIIIVACLFITLGYGQIPEIERSIKVATITANLPERENEKWYDVLPPIAKTNDWINLYQKYASLTREAANKNAKIIAWPEYALILKGMVDESNLKTSLIDLANKLDVTIVASYINVQSRKNVAYGITPSGEEVTYYKQRLVGVVESSWLTSGLKDFELLYVKELDLNIGIRICYDNDFPMGTREAIKAGAEIMITPYADWDGVSETHARLNAMHAAENHISTLRAARGGLSTIVGPEGEIIKSGRSDLTPDQVLIAELPISKPGTIYSKFGDWLGWLCMMFIIVMGGIRIRVIYKKI
ncbi:MAG: nitrilase-related carbon-nitrogen hydrolase [Bermanella sp.]